MNPHKQQGQQDGGGNGQQRDCAGVCRGGEEQSACEQERTYIKKQDESLLASDGVEVGEKKEKCKQVEHYNSAQQDELGKWCCGE